MLQQEGSQARDATNVRWAGDHDRLMAGEQPESPFRDDAIHWVRVYRDLVAFNRQLVDAITERLQSRASPDGHANPESRDGSGQPDLELLQAYLDRLRWRLEFWEGRIAE